MINEGYWKNVNTQEYLEELIRLTYPAAKVNNIIPFCMRVDPSYNPAAIVGVDFTTMYFIQVTPFALGAPVHDGGHLSWIESGLSVSATFEALNLNTSGYMLVSHFSGNLVGGQGFYVQGYKISLDNTIAVLGGAAAPTVLNIVGIASRGVTFYCAGINNSAGFVRMLQMHLSSTGDIDTLTPVIGGVAGVDYNEDAPGSQTYTIFDNQPNPSGVLPYQLTIKPFDSTVPGVYAPSVNLDLQYDIKPYDYQYGEYIIGGLKLHFQNCTVGAILACNIFDAAGVSRDFFNHTVTTTSFIITRTIAGAAIVYTTVPQTPKIQITPELSGQTCLFNFIHEIFVP